MRSSALGLLLVLGGCRAPDNALTAQCQSEMLATGDPQRCKVAVNVIDGPKRITLDTSTSFHTANVLGRFQIRKGSAQVVVQGSAGELRTRVTAGTESTFGGKVKLVRPIGAKHHFFTLLVEPEAGAEGFSGTVDYDSRD